MNNPNLVRKWVVNWNFYYTTRKEIILSDVSRAWDEVQVEDAKKLLETGVGTLAVVGNIFYPDVFTFDCSNVKNRLIYRIPADNSFQFKVNAIDFHEGFIRVLCESSKKSEILDLRLLTPLD